MGRYLLIAVLLHLVLFTILMVRFDWWSSESPPATAAIQAVVVDRLPQGDPQPPAVERDREQEEIRKREEMRNKQEERKRVEAERLRKEREQAERRAAEEKRRREIELAERKRAQQEEQRKAEEARRKAEEEKRKKAEQEARRKKEEEERRKRAEEERRRREAQRRRREEELKSLLAAEEEFLEGERRRKNQAELERYIERVRSRVESRWREPPNAREGMSTTVRIRLSPSGEVLVVKTVQSSGDAVFDRSVEAAVRKASPLPLPSDTAILPDFPEMNFKFIKES